MEPDRRKPTSEAFPFPSRDDAARLEAEAGKTPDDPPTGHDAAASVVPVHERTVSVPSEAAIDHGGEESFPASDPMAVVVDEWTEPAPHDPLARFWQAHKQAIALGSSLTALAFWWWRSNRRH